MAVCIVTEAELRQCVGLDSEVLGTIEDCFQGLGRQKIVQFANRRDLLAHRQGLPGVGFSAGRFEHERDVREDFEFLILLGGDVVTQDDRLIDFVELRKLFGAQTSHLEVWGH